MDAKLNTFIVAVAAQKGGVGKTAVLRALIFAVLQETGSLALVDSDPQLTLMKFIRNRRRLHPELPSPDTFAIRRDDESPLTLTAETIAKRVVKSIEELSGQYKVILVDTAPLLAVPSLAAAKVSNAVVVPCQVSDESVDPIGDTIEIAEVAKKPALITLNMAHPPRSRISGTNATNLEIARQVAGKFPYATLSRTLIPTRKAVKDSYGQGLLPQEMQKGSELEKKFGLIWDEIKQVTLETGNG